MSTRANKWWLFGVVMWLLCGVVPGYVAGVVFLYDNLSWSTLLWHWFGPSIALSCIACAALPPPPRQWVATAVAVIWALGWFYLWLPMILRTMRTLSSGGDEGLFLSITLSGFVTNALLFWITRSWRVVIAAAFAAALTGLPSFDPTPFTLVIGWGLWHPIVVGALLCWAVPKKIHPFPAHACQSCGYDRRGLESKVVCPECGAA